MVMLYRDPHGQQVFIAEKGPQSNRVIELEAQCQELEMRLAEYEVLEWFLLYSGLVIVAPWFVNCS